MAKVKLFFDIFEYEELNQRMEDNETNEKHMYAFLALVDNVPLILGFKDLLSKFKVAFDFRTKEAYIEE